ncbi:MAG: hypothetical protein RMI04_09220 [Thermofilaceae archaeon]|nr:hypothetical protein [Thermofilaceae archaeon]
MAYWKARLVSKYRKREVALLCLQALRLMQQENVSAREAFERLGVKDLYDLLGEKKEQRIRALAAVGKYLEQGHSLNTAVKKAAEENVGYTEKGLMTVLYAVSGSEKPEETVKLAKKRMKAYVNKAHKLLKRAECYTYMIDNDKAKNMLKKVLDDIITLKETL